MGQPSARRNATIPVFTWLFRKVDDCAKRRTATRSDGLFSIHNICDQDIPGGRAANHSLSESFPTPFEVFVPQPIVVRRGATFRGTKRTPHLGTRPLAG